MTKQDIKEFMLEEFEYLWYNCDKEVMSSEIKDGYGFKVEIFSNGNIVQLTTYKQTKEFDCGLIRNMDDVEKRIDEMLS